MQLLDIWPVHPQILPDELLSSWLMRIASGNGLKLHSFTHRAFPNVSIWNRDIDKTVSDNVLSILSKRSGRPFKEVFQTTLKSYEGYLAETVIDSKTKWILPLGIYHRTHKRKGLCFCPLCLAEDNIPYFRRLWRLGFSVVCTKHSVWMLDACPNCNMPIAFHRNDFEHKYNPTEKGMNICYNCEFDLRSSNITKETDSLFLEFLINIEKALVEGYIILDNKPIYSHLYFNVLFQMLKLITINKHGLKLRTLLEKRLKSIPEILLNQQIRFVDDLPMQERRYSLRIISYLFKNWPNNFIKLCNEAQLSKSRLDKDISDIPYWFSNVLYKKLDESFYSPSNQEIKAAHYHLKKTNKTISRKALLDIMGFKDSKIISNYWKNNND